MTYHGSLLRPSQVIHFLGLQLGRFSQSKNFPENRMNFEDQKKNFCGFSYAHGPRVPNHHEKRRKAQILTELVMNFKDTPQPKTAANFSTNHRIFSSLCR
jgi:hypothetical protein